MSYLADCAYIDCLIRGPHTHDTTASDQRQPVPPPAASGEVCECGHGFHDATRCDAGGCPCRSSHAPAATAELTREEDDGVSVPLSITMDALIHARCNQEIAALRASRDAERAEVARLRAAIEWVLNDAYYKAPEQIDEVARRWISRLKDATS
jgi:hypothetical protein